MSRYTRFANTNSRLDTARPQGRQDYRTEAERVFDFTPPRPLTREEKTSEIARQIVLDETVRRQTLSEALRAARLERAGRISENARNKREPKKDT